MTPLTSLFPELARLAEADAHPRGVFAGGKIQLLSNGDVPSAENTTYLCESQFEPAADPAHLRALSRRIRRAWYRALTRPVERSCA